MSLFFYGKTVLSMSLGLKLCTKSEVQKSTMPFHPKSVALFFHCQLQSPHCF